MKFRQLEAFRSIMKTGTMLASAQLMHISQPAVSRLITDLEADIGFKLFNRRRGTISPTDEGMQFFADVEENFLGLERLQNAAAQIRKDGQSLRVAVTHVLSAALMPKVVARFHQRYPDCRVLVHSHRLEQVIIRMQNMAVDISIGGQLPSMSTNRRVLIGSSTQVCIMPQAHRLAAKDHIVAADLANENVLGILNDGPAYWNHPIKQLAQSNVAHKNSVEVDTSFTGYAMIAEGIAIGIIEPLGFRFWEGHGLIRRPFLPEIRTEYHYATPKRPGPRSELEWFERCLLVEAANLPSFTVAK